MKVSVDDSAAMRMIKRMADGAANAARAVVAELSALGEFKAKTAAQVTSPTLAGSIRQDPIKDTVDGAEGGFGTNMDYAAFVEYGTGRPGAQGLVKNGEPRDPRAAGFAYTMETVVASGPQQGAIRQGWVYWDDVRQTFVHTYGQPAGPFMYPAKLAVEQAAGDTAAAVVQETLGG